MIKDLVKLDLNESELKLIENGWGYEVAYKTVTKKFFYKSGGFDVNGYLAYPEKIDKKMPVIIWNRGGNEKSGLLDDFLASGILGEIASWGYIVFASQYRKKDEFGGRDVSDVLNLIEEAKCFELSDNTKIGMEGWSRGGMMSYLTLTRTDEIKCCIIVAGLSNLERNIENNPKLLEVYKNHFGCKDEKEFIERMKNRSAINRYDKISKSSNILFIHGTADEKISYLDSEEMYGKLKELNGNTKYEIRLIENGGHYLRNERKIVSGFRKKWFEENLINPA
jgi:dipeptidyl aminopeptidase/acylaminoacyl peptidase